jgi:hypothetical protein
MAATLGALPRTLFFEEAVTIGAGANARIVRAAPRAHPFARPNIRSQPARVVSLVDQQGGTRGAVRSDRCPRAGVRHGADAMNRPILGLVRPRVLAYLGARRVKTATLQTASFGSPPDLSSIDGGRHPSARRVLRRSHWCLKGGRVSLDPCGIPDQCRSLADRAPTDKIMSLREDNPAGGAGAAGGPHVER